MKAIARTKYLKGSARKARLVIDLIRGKSVPQALAILNFTNKRAAGPIEKTLRSAIANATYKAEKENVAIDPADLYVAACYVDIGPTKHRWRIRPAPQGRAYRERRHYCHITIEVSTEREIAKADNSQKGKSAVKAEKELKIEQNEKLKTEQEAQSQKETKETQSTEISATEAKSSSETKGKRGRRKKTAEAEQEASKESLEKSERESE
jgi:large subunit ribosomal protein L22